MKNFKYTKNQVLTASILLTILIIFSAFMFSCSGKNSQTSSQEISGSSNQEDYEVFEEKMRTLTGQLKESFAESHKLEEEIKKNLKSIGFNI